MKKRPGNLSEKLVLLLRPYWFALLLCALVSGLLFMTLTLFRFEQTLMLLLMFTIGIVCIASVALYLLLETLDPDYKAGFIGGILGFERYGKAAKGSRSIGDKLALVFITVAAFYAIFRLYAYLFH